MKLWFQGERPWLKRLCVRRQFGIKRLYGIKDSNLFLSYLSLSFSYKQTFLTNSTNFLQFVWISALKINLIDILLWVYRLSRCNNSRKRCPEHVDSIQKVSSKHANITSIIHGLTVAIRRSLRASLFSSYKLREETSVIASLLLNKVRL